MIRSVNKYKKSIPKCIRVRGKTHWRLFADTSLLSLPLVCERFGGTLEYLKTCFNRELLARIVKLSQVSIQENAENTFTLINHYFHFQRLNPAKQTRTLMKCLVRLILIKKMKWWMNKTGPVRSTEL